MLIVPGAEPAVVEDEEFDSGFFRFRRDFQDPFLVEVQIGRAHV